MKKHRGILITFEGIDGCGKSTQARKLCARLRSQGYDVLLIREPGGTPTSEKIRRVLLDRKLTISPKAELLLYEAARAHLTETVIDPALKAGRIVICDRYFDSTTAYQGYGRGLNLALIGRLNGVASLNITPNLTFVFDIDYDTSCARRGSRPDRLEGEKRAFFERVRRGFRSLGHLWRVVILDGRQDKAFVFDQVLRRAEGLIRRKTRPHAG